MMTIKKLNKIIEWANKKKIRLQELYNVEIVRVRYRWYNVSYYWWIYLIDTDDYQYKKEWSWYANDYLQETWQELK